MREEREKRIVRAAEYIVEHRATVRETAKALGVSKSTIHKDVTERIARFDGALAREVEAVLRQNKAERHLRGGEATRAKYRGESGRQLGRVWANELVADAQQSRGTFKQ